MAVTMPRALCALLFVLVCVLPQVLSSELRLHDGGGVRFQFNETDLVVGPTVPDTLEMKADSVRVYGHGHVSDAVNVLGEVEMVGGGKVQGGAYIQSLEARETLVVNGTDVAQHAIDVRLEIEAFTDSITGGESMPFSKKGRIEFAVGSGVFAYNLSGVHPNASFYAGGFCHEQYCYIADSKFGVAMRVDTDAPLDLADSYTPLDLSEVHPYARGFIGGCLAWNEEYGVFSPHGRNDTDTQLSDLEFHGLAVRVNLAVWNSSGVETLWLNETHPNLVGTVFSQFLDPHVYFFTNRNATDYTALVARVNSSFTSSAVEYIDVSDTLAGGVFGLAATGVWGTDIYVVAAGDLHDNSMGKVLRIDSLNFTSANVEGIDLTVVNPALVGFVAAVMHEGMFYISPFSNNISHGNLVRVDTADFTTSGVSFVNLTSVHPDFRNFLGCVVDAAGYLMLAPSENGQIARVHTGDFTTNGVSRLDVQNVHNSLNSFYQPLINLQTSWVLFPPLHDDKLVAIMGST